MIAISRAVLLRSLFSLPLLPLPAPAFQADDKSFDFELPPSWKLQAEPPRADPAHLFRVVATRSDGVAQLEMTVDAIEGKKGLSSLGSLDSVAQKLLTSQPQPATLIAATKAAGNGFFAAGTYEFRYRVGPDAHSRVLKIALQQERLYTLAVDLPAEPSEAVASEVDSIVGSWKAFPINAGCLRQSNRGTVMAGVCY
jgi:hypothetical protein